MQRDKVTTLLGFAVKARKLVYGLDTISDYKKKLHLMIVCPSLSLSSKNEAVNISAKRNITLIETKNKLEEILFKQNCKVAALSDSNMAKAIIDNLNENYKVIELKKETT